MSSKPILYGMDVTPGTRSVRMIAHLIGLEIENVELDLFGGEHLTERFRKMNPQHTIPTIDDNGCYVWETAVICTYLIDKYAKNDELYPKDLYKRAQCNQRLHFTDALLYQRLRNCSMNFYKGGTKVPQSDIDAVYEAYEHLEAFLTISPYLLGDRLSVADFCAISLMASLDAIYAPVDPNKYPKIFDWLARMKALPYYEEFDGQHVKSYKALLESIKEKNEKK